MPAFRFYSLRLKSQQFWGDIFKIGLVSPNVSLLNVRGVEEKEDKKKEDKEDKKKDEGVYLKTHAPLGGDCGSKQIKLIYK